jgi:sugar phosphate isomerase/epimerase
MSEWPVSAFADEAGGTADEQIEALKAAGLRHIDIRGIDGFNITTLPLEQAKATKTKLDAAGISVQMFGSPIGKIDIADDLETDLAKLRHLGTLAPVLGCGAIRIFSYYNKQNAPHAEWQQKSLARLSRLRDTAKELGLTLYHENERHIFGDLAADVETIGTELRDGATFFMIFDFDNYNQSDENVWDAWVRLRDQVDSFHLKDSAEKQHVPVGAGTGSIKRILTDAIARGWSGPVSVEPHLSHSGAVAATGPSGIENLAYGKMKPSESFHIACEAATKLLAAVGVTVG